MKIKGIMTTDAISVSPETSLSNIVDIIYQYGFHGLPVVENKKVIGIITEDDFFLKDYDDLYLPAYIRFIRENKIVGNLPPEIREKIGKILAAKAKDIMTADPITVSPEMGVAELMDLIKKTKFVTFPVADENKNLIGVVTLADILGTVKKGTLEMRKAMKGTKEIEGLAKEMDSAWRDNFIIVTRKKIRTWAGMALILVVAGLGAAVLLIANMKSNAGVDIEKRNVYPLECQKFNYSDWSACKNDGTQERQLLEKLPQGCEGGGTPELARQCK